jgi:hypothetical protein
MADNHAQSERQSPLSLIGDRMKFRTTDHTLYLDSSGVCGNVLGQGKLSGCLPHGRTAKALVIATMLFVMAG